MISRDVALRLAILLLAAASTTAQARSRPQLTGCPATLDALDATLWSVSSASPHDEWHVDNEVRYEPAAGTVYGLTPGGMELYNQAGKRVLKFVFPGERRKLADAFRNQYGSSCPDGGRDSGDCNARWDEAPYASGALSSAKLEWSEYGDNTYLICRYNPRRKTPRPAG